MIHINFHRVRPDKVELLRSWLEELNRRQDEVKETFRREGVRHEAAYLLQDSEGTILAYAVETEDLEGAHAAYAASDLPIDHQHRRIMAEVLGDRVDMELMYRADLE